MEGQSEIVEIADIESLYPDEWLLFEVVEIDENNQPIRGRLLFHSPDRALAEQKWLETDCEFTYLYFNGEPLPEDWVAVL